MPRSKVKTSTNARPERHGPLTWIVSGLGLLVIVTAIVIVALDATNRETPPDLRVSETGRSTSAGVTRVEIEIRNNGGQAASAVEVSGKSASGETGQVSLDYVAGQSHREATLAFPGDPGPVTLSVTGWTQP
ncbi:MAG: hypothetical protein EON96_03885 [Caulobacteraceae bacterium]|nr:MAG: hypothetical protein EON96_03885 [Caulobacteraceae bacterium]